MNRYSTRVSEDIWQIPYENAPPTKEFVFLITSNDLNVPKIGEEGNGEAIPAHSVFFHPACQSATGLCNCLQKFHRKDSSTFSYEDAGLIQAPVVSLNYTSLFSVVTFALSWIVGGNGDSGQNGPNGMLDDVDIDVSRSCI
jgi:hypothetical protein